MLPRSRRSAVRHVLMPRIGMQAPPALGPLVIAPPGARVSLAHMRRVERRAELSVHICICDRCLFHPHREASQACMPPASNEAAPVSLSVLEEGRPRVVGGQRYLWR